MQNLPCIVLTRRLPDAVEARAERTYRVRLNRDDIPWSAGEWLARTHGMEGVLCTVTDNLSRAVIESLPDTVRILATFSVGFNHIDVAAARTRGIVVTNTPDVLTDSTADIA